MTCIPSKIKYNNGLIEHGIYNEESDIRAHVSPTTKSIFVFRTPEMINLLFENNYKEAPATQQGTDEITANGLLVPVDDIPDLRILKYNSFEWWKDFSKKMSTSERGKQAVVVVNRIIKIGRFPLWCDPIIIEDVKIDISGTDMLVVGKWKIQVKCDYDAGYKKDGGTGNLYIQTHERNPFKNY